MIVFCLGSFAKDATQGSGLRLNHRRARKLADQWICEGTFQVMPPLIVTIEKDVAFDPLEETIEAGFGTMNLPVSKIIDICDGIHRVAALKLLENSEASLIASEWPIEFIECDDEMDAIRLSERIRNESSLRPSAMPKPLMNRESTP